MADATKTKFQQQLASHLVADQEITLRLVREGPAVIKFLRGTMSLREIGRRASLSPTYLSQVVNDKTVISPAAYLKLAKLV